MSRCENCGTQIGAVAVCPNCGSQAGGPNAVLTASVDGPGAEPEAVSAHAIAAFTLSMICVLIIVTTLLRMSDVEAFLPFIVRMMMLTIVASVVTISVGNSALTKIKERNQRGRLLAVTAVRISRTILILFPVSLVLAPLIILGVGTWPTGSGA